MCSQTLFMLLSLMGTITSVICVHRRICYYTNWSQYRQKIVKFLPSNIHPYHCTHICFAFAKLEGNKLKSFEWNDESEPWNTGLYERLNNLKQINPNLKTLLSVGGWNMGSEPFMAMVATYATRKTFIDDAIIYLRRRNFDGLDIDWEYPANRGSPPEDKPRYTALIREVRIAFEEEAARTGKPRLLIAAAVAAGKDKIDTGYDVPGLHPYFDFITIMTYDYHGPWENKTGHNSPLLPAEHEIGKDRLLNMFWSMQYWYSHGVPKQKMNLGLALYGRSFSLANPGNNSLGAPIINGGRPGLYTRERGFLAYYEICQMGRDGAIVRWMNDQKVPYLVKGNQWVGYDNPRSLHIKVRWAVANQFGGIAVWSLDLDDFSGICPGRQKYPLMNTILRSLDVHVPVYTPPIRKDLPQLPMSTIAPASHRSSQQGPQSKPQLKAAEICGQDMIGYVADPHSCQYFYICNQVRVFRYRCHAQTLWDDVKKKCEWKWKVQCKSSQQQSQKSLAPDSDAFISPRTGQVAMSTHSTGNSSSYCTNRNDGTYKDPSGCNGFLQCSGGLTYPHLCPSGTVFDEVHKYCDFRQNVPGC